MVGDSITTLEEWMDKLQAFIGVIVVCQTLQFSTPSALAMETASDAEKPNFVVIMVDDMGWTGLSNYGSDLHQTPHIDQLAADGMKFNQAYASAPVCTPTRAAFMTGKSPAQLNMTIWHEASRQPPTNRPLIPRR